MTVHDEYVDLRVQRLKQADLERRPNKWLATLPQFNSAERVLDIACGMGYDSQAWAREGKKAVGIDWSWGLVQNAKELAQQQGLKIDFTVGDATRLPFPNGSFDFCFSENLFEHVPEWQKIAAEANRVLRHGGVFFIRTTNRHCPYNPEINNLHFYPWLPYAIKRPILKWIQRNRPAWINYSHFPAVNWFTHRGLAKSLQSLGFITCEMSDLVQKGLLSGKWTKFNFIFELLRHYKICRYLIYPLLTSVEIVAVKNSPLDNISISETETVGVASVV